MPRRRPAAISKRQRLRTRGGISRQKNAISLKEMRETLYWLRLILKCNLASPELVRPLLVEADELTAMLTAGMKRLHPIALFMLAVVVSALISVFSF
jgi:hypothetical protein